MADIVQILTAITSFLVSLFILLKSVKYIRTPCFKIQLNETQQVDATLLEYIKHRATPRKPNTTRQEMPAVAV